MRLIGAVLCAIISLSLFSIERLMAQAQQASPNVPTIRVTSRLVFLDVTVLDKKGHPVVKGLTKDDFTITDNKRPQRIFSFEAPDVHVVDANTRDDGRAGKAPVTIFVLDLLNSSFEDFGYIRFMVRRYLSEQPAQLSSPAELMVLGNKSLEMVQGYTRSKADLLYALDHVPAALPYKEMHGFLDEQFYQSIDALQEIALQNKGVHERKNIVWVGLGGPSLATASLPAATVDYLNGYVHTTTNMLVDARVSLFVIYPRLRVSAPPNMSSSVAADTQIGDGDPFAGDINFGVLVNETGGNLFYNRNDIDTEMKQAEELGSEYYTLTYQPPEGNADGKFRRIRVTLRDPSLRVVTKTGYFSPDEKAPASRLQAVAELSEAARSTIPLDSLEVSIESILRHPDSGRVEFAVVVSPRNLDWHPAEDGKSTTDLLLAAASLDGSRDFLASRMESLTIGANSQDAARLAKTGARLHVTVRIPRKTKSVRVVIQTAGSGRTGAVELDRKTIDAAPEGPTPEPKLIPRPVNVPSSDSPPGE